MVLGVLCGGYYMYNQTKKRGKSTELAFDLIVFPLLTGIIASRLSYYFIYLKKDNSIIEALRIWDGGMVSWGGFIVAIFTLLFVLKRYKEKPYSWLDIYSISALLGLSVGRLGSFVSGEYAGVPTTLFSSFGGVHPVTLYESILLFVLFLIYIYLYAKNSLKIDGYYFLSVLIWYSLIRFLMDFLRVDPKYFIGLSLTQIISSLIILSVTTFFFYKIFLRKGVKRVG